MSTAYCWQQIFAWHDTGGIGRLAPGIAVEPYPHMEGPDAKARLAALVEVSGLLPSLTRIDARPASVEELLRVHTERYVEFVRKQSEADGGFAESGCRTPFGEGAFSIASLSAGGVIAVAEAVMDGQVANGYALVRPPGHHATRKSGMGYCIFANIAIAIHALRHARSGLRVAVVDWDVHHGNGTEELFIDDPTVLTMSVHEQGLYPARAGGLPQTGTGAGAGCNLNVPLPAGSGNGAYVDVVERVLAPAVERFRPSVIFVACGFDAGAMDPMGHQTVTASGFRTMTSRLMDVADRVCDSRLVMAHEGGYSPYYVPVCGLAVLEELSGKPTGLQDPYERFDLLPSQTLTAEQHQVIDAAAALVDLIPQSNTAAAEEV